MAMNRLHQWLCSSEKWAGMVKEQILPWALADVDLGDDVLEIGPGYGATTRVLVKRVPSLCALEIDEELAHRLSKKVSGVRVVRGDGTRMPFADATFSGVACFTMLHHIPAPSLQDGLFAEAFRVLRPGGVFAGSDSVTSLPLRLLHVFDTMVLVEPEMLPRRLEAVGFRDITVRTDPGRAFKFRAHKPAAH